MTRTISGWLFDAYAQGEDVSVWVIDDEGVPHHLRDQVQPSFFVGGSPAELHRVCEWLHGARLPVNLKRAERYDIFARDSLVVLEVQVLIPALYERIIRRVTDTFPNLEFYNADLTIPQVYFYERDLFPLARCEALVNEADEILEIEAENTPWDLDYSLPPLRTMLLRLEGENRNPNHGYRAPLEVSYDDRTYVLQTEDSRDLVRRVREHLVRADPDVILSDWGDSFILPQLMDLAQRYGVDLPFNRDTRRKPHLRPAQSYFSYGRIIYKTASQLLFGRWHIDRENAFLTDDYGLGRGVRGGPPDQAPRAASRAHLDRRGDQRDGSGDRLPDGLPDSLAQARAGRIQVGARPARVRQRGDDLPTDHRPAL